MTHPLLALPDPDLMHIIETRTRIVAAKLCTDGFVPPADKLDAFVAFQRIYMHLWLELYGRTLYKHGSHDAAVYMASHRQVVKELGRETFRRVEAMFGWTEVRELG